MVPPRTNLSSSARVSRPSALLGSSRPKRVHRTRARLKISCGPQPETEKERSPIDYPQEWVTPQPSKRPDIFPEFETQETPLPKPLPGDPEQPVDEEWEEENKKKPDTDPEKVPPDEDSDDEKEKEDDEEEEKKKEGPQPEE